MELFKMPFKGNEVVVSRNGNKYIIRLPDRTSTTGAHFREKIENDEYGWKYSCESLDVLTEYFNVWISNDRRIGWKSNNDKDINWFENGVDLIRDKSDIISSRARDIFEVVGKLCEYERVKVPLKDIIDLRRAKLYMTLKMLGYSSIEAVQKPLEDKGLYYALGEVSKELEDYTDLSFIKLKQDKLLGSYYDINIPAEVTQEDVMNMAEKVKSVGINQKEFIDDKDENLELVRDLEPDYCTDMSRKVSREDWEKYSRQVRKTAEFVLGLNYDLLTPEQSRGIKDLSGLQESELQDRISGLIDSPDFEKACNIEDKFIISEADRFCGKIDELVEDKRVASAVGASLFSLKEKALRERNIRQNYSSKYEKFQEVFGNADKIQFRHKDSPEGVEPSE